MIFFPHIRVYIKMIVDNYNIVDINTYCSTLHSVPAHIRESKNSIVKKTNGALFVYTVLRIYLKYRKTLLYFR